MVDSQKKNYASRRVWSHGAMLPRITVPRVRIAVLAVLAAAEEVERRVFVFRFRCSFWRCVCVCVCVSLVRCWNEFGFSFSLAPGSFFNVRGR